MAPQPCRFHRTWHVNFFPPLVEALLYLFAIGMGIGSYVTEIEGIPYVTFIAPAILAIAVMNSAFFECTYGSMSGCITRKVLMP